MGRTFAYCRVSTVEQTTENQIQAMKAKGYTFDEREERIFSEAVSGGVMAKERPEFQRLLNKIEGGDTIVVLKLDRLGRDAQDIYSTVNLLQEKRVTLKSLDLPDYDLASAEGRLVLGIFSAFAEFEKNRIRERTQEGLSRAILEGKRLGRPKGSNNYKTVQEAKEDGLSQSKVAKKLGLGIATVKRHWN